MFRPFRASVPFRPSVSQGGALGCDVSALSGQTFFVPRSKTAGSLDRPSYGNEVLHCQGLTSILSSMAWSPGSVGFVRTITQEPSLLSFPDQFRFGFPCFVELFRPGGREGRGRAGWRGGRPGCGGRLPSVRLVARAQVAVQLRGGTQLRVPTSDPDVLQHVIEMPTQADAQRAGGLSCQPRRQTCASTCMHSPRTCTGRFDRLCALVRNVFQAAPSTEVSF